jgi:GNAT superfamily N-acetyltransferase
MEVPPESASKWLIRPGRPEDVAASALVFASAPAVFSRLAGSPERARRILTALWVQPGHSASFEFASVAECDGAPVGVVTTFPASARYRLHGALLLQALRRLPRGRWPVVGASLLQVAVLTPRPPGDSLYIAAIAVAPGFRLSGIGSGLIREAETAARRAGFTRVAGNTGHSVMHAGAAKRGYRKVAGRSRGYALLIKDLGAPA